MERGIEQFFLIGVVILAALLDLVMRVARRKNGADRPPVGPPVDDDSVYWNQEEFEARERERLERERLERIDRLERLDRERIEQQHRLERERVARDPRPPVEAPAPIRRPAPTPAPARASAPVPARVTSPARITPIVPPPRPLQVVPPPRSRARIGRMLLQPADARRGIVLMSVLGPCRALEGERQP